MVVVNFYMQLWILAREIEFLLKLLLYSYSFVTDPRNWLGVVRTSSHKLKVV